MDDASPVRINRDGVSLTEAQLEAPGISDPANVDLSANSPSAAMVDSGNLSISTAVDHDGFSRDPLPDVGAGEWGGTGPIFADGFEAADVSAWSGTTP